MHSIMGTGPHLLVDISLREIPAKHRQLSTDFHPSAFWLKINIYDSPSRVLGAFVETSIYIFTMKW